MPDVSSSLNDPAELLEVLDPSGGSTGVGVSRAEVHRRGLWHRAFHCWIVRPGPDGLQVVLQRRSLHKDTFPGSWDAAAAGHWRLGESPEQAAREIDEELGIHPPFDSLRLVGRERCARGHANGLADREIHEVYLLEWPAPLAAYRPDPAEVSGLCAVDAAHLLRLASGRLEAIPAPEAVEVAPDGSVRPSALTVQRAHFVPYSAARLRRLLHAAGNTRPSPPVVST